MYVLGLDVGTQGARALVLDARGVCYAAARVRFTGRVDIPGLPPGHREHNPACWTAALEHAVLQAVDQLRDVNVPPDALAAVAVTGTSGTVLALDEAGKPLRPALMYNDTRAADEAREIRSVAADHCARHGYRPGPSFGLPKLLWLARHEPETIEQARHLVHATDFLTGRLLGECGHTSFSDALKSCCDLFSVRWPDFIADLGLPVEKLPRLHAPGDPLGAIDPAVADRLGLPRTMTVCAGCTDGTAGFLAGGASEPGESCTTIGTTLVLRTVSDEVLHDPAGRIYCHRHPDGRWLPGGASSVGAECLRVRLPDADHEALSRAAGGLLPSEVAAYPLVRAGERFPFVDPGAEGFLDPEPQSDAELYAALIQGVACVERWGYDVLAELGRPATEEAHTVGGGARNTLWGHLRANILGRPVALPRLAEPAVGAAILAAHGAGVENAFRNMVSIRETIDPDPRQVDRYEACYRRFREACRNHGLGEPA